MGDVLRVVTANLWNGRADPEGFAALVETLRADVVCVQELSPDQAEALAAVMPHGRLEPCNNHQGLGIALRHPAPVERLPLRYRDARTVLLAPGAWPGLREPIEIVNVHFAAPVLWPYHRQPAVRGAQVEGVLAHVERTPEHRRVVLGDYNATPIWPVYRRMRARLEDVAQTHARTQGRRAAGTWPHWSWLPRGLRFLRIDHCMSHGLTVESVEVVPIPGSDHDALRVDFALD